eukprot:Seg8790.1 transcript_id=Seg8790.1/GoldUCD/mRNA.D3Y31 product="hypothetical protein" pseudo=true protein_id=Seg8790.1/GoldUCD/D3Y31
MQWIEGVVRLRDTDYSGIEGIFSEGNLELYGIDPDGPIPEDDEYQVSVPGIRSGFSEENILSLQVRVPDPCYDDGQFGARIYTDVVTILGEFVL